MDWVRREGGDGALAGNLLLACRPQLNVPLSFVYTMFLVKTICKMRSNLDVKGGGGVRD